MAAGWLTLSWPPLLYTLPPCGLGFLKASKCPSGDWECDLFHPQEQAIFTATTLSPGSCFCPCSQMCSLPLVCVTLCIPLWSNVCSLTFPSIVFLVTAGLCRSKSGRICRLWIHCPLLLAGRIRYQEHPTGQLHPKGTIARTYAVEILLRASLRSQCQPERRSCYVQRQDFAFVLLDLLGKLPIIRVAL